MDNLIDKKIHKILKQKTKEKTKMKTSKYVCPICGSQLKETSFLFNIYFVCVCGESFKMGNVILPIKENYTDTIQKPETKESNNGNDEIGNAEITIDTKNGNENDGNESRKQ